MRRLLYSLLVILSSPTIFAQGEVAVDVAALQQLIEDQNRLLNDQYPSRAWAMAKPAPSSPSRLETGTRQSS